MLKSDQVNESVTVSVCHVAKLRHADTVSDSSLEACCVGRSQRPFGWVSMHAVLWVSTVGAHTIQQSPALVYNTHLCSLALAGFVSQRHATASLFTCRLLPEGVPGRTKRRHFRWAVPGTSTDV